MKIQFEMVGDPALRAKLESLDFDPETAERLVEELVLLLRDGHDLASIWVNLYCDETDCNRVVEYDLTGLPARCSRPGQA